MNSTLGVCSNQRTNALLPVVLIGVIHLGSNLQRESCPHRDLDRAIGALLGRDYPGAGSSVDAARVRRPSRGAAAAWPRQIGSHCTEPGLFQVSWLFLPSRRRQAPRSTTECPARRTSRGTSDRRSGRDLFRNLWLIAVSNLDSTWLHGLRHLTDRVNRQQAAIQAGVCHPDVVGQAEPTAECTIGDTAVEITGCCRSRLSCRPRLARSVER